MVEQVTAWRDSAGKIHASQLDAARADAKILLEKILGNQVLVTSVLENAGQVVDALRPFTEQLEWQQARAAARVDEERYPSISRRDDSDVPF